jgi:hypothetical protein
MARQETDREDLLREATALVERIELAPPGGTEAEHIVAGFRRQGAWSVYFGADPAYHFNPAGELRRAYIDGLLYKAQDRRLVALERVRAEREVQLVSRTLSEDAQCAILAALCDRLSDLAQRLADDELTTIGQVPSEADVRGRVARWLTENKEIRVATQPHAR